MIPIPKGPLSALVCNYRPISITPVLSKVFERFGLGFGRFLERSRVLPSHQYSYRKSLGTCDALLDVICAGQLELDRGGELALVQIDFRMSWLVMLTTLPCFVGYHILVIRHPWQHH